MITKINRKWGNWETIAFMIIKKILVCKNPHFSRSELMTMEHLNFAVILSSALGHIDKPRHPEETLQRTIQNMRDKNLIKFHGDGEYELTKLGYYVMEKLSGRFPYSELKKAMGQA
ncbi:MAG: hypothetical protein ACYS3N_17135 [Planctomycetota bacterium]|jgi:hypothetical protein